MPSTRNELEMGADPVSRLLERGAGREAEQRRRIGVAASTLDERGDAQPHDNINALADRLCEVIDAAPRVDAHELAEALFLAAARRLGPVDALSVLRLVVNPA